MKSIINIISLACVAICAYHLVIDGKRELKRRRRNKRLYLLDAALTAVYLKENTTTKELQGIPVCNKEECALWADNVGISLMNLTALDEYTFVAQVSPVDSSLVVGKCAFEPISIEYPFIPFNARMAILKIRKTKSKYDSIFDD